MHTIVFLDRGAVRATFRAPEFPHEWRDYQETAEAEVVNHLRDATIAVTNKVPLRAETLRQLPALRLIVVAATGYDRVDVDYCQKNGIAVCNVQNYAGDTVPEHVMMLMLALRRNLPAYRAAVRDGAWQRSTTFCLLDHPVRDLRGETFGVIGYGQLGRATARLAAAFGMRVIVAEHRNAGAVRPDRVSFDQLLTESDVISLHCPLTPQTRNLIGADELARLRPGALLINTARGGIVDEAALVAALKENRLGGAGIDVLTVEPPREGNPLLDLDLPNLIVTPHIAWTSLEAMQSLAETVIVNMESFVDGAPRNLVTPS